MPYSSKFCNPWLTFNYSTIKLAYFKEKRGAIKKKKGDRLIYL
jgi:hypothetical protein